ncbi:MAG: peroxiredoxin-like family protein [Nonlabens sp.]
MKPKDQMPSLELPLINDARYKLEEQNPDKYSLLIFYRGLHCPVCKKQLSNIQDHLDKLVDRGINLVAISMDNEERAKKAGNEWDVTSLPIAYDLSEEKAREFGLFISTGISDKEPDTFSEPGMFLVDKDNKLFFSSVQSMPFARPSIEDIINAVDFIEENGYPPRGTK